jgi:hypothetical protein
MNVTTNVEHGDFVQKGREATMSIVVRHQMDSLVVVVLFVLAAAAIILWIIKPR